MLRALCVVGVIWFLTACGGGGGGSSRSSEELSALRSDPRIVRLGQINNRSDTLRMSDLRIDYSVRAQGETFSEAVTLNASCQGDRCSAGGETVSLADLLDPANDIELTNWELGSWGGFDTIRASGSGSIDSPTVEGVTANVSAHATSYGLWGKYGYASVETGRADVSGRTQGIRFTGDMRYAVGYAYGDATGLNPVGAGSATWHGIARAISKHTYATEDGTVALTLEDLSRPFMDVDIEGITSEGTYTWEDVPLSNGHFSSRRGSVRRPGFFSNVGTYELDGGLYGPNHEEAYGVFHAGDYVGSFGASRQ